MQSLFQRRRRNGSATPWLIASSFWLALTTLKGFVAAQEMSDTSDATDRSSLTAEEILLKVFDRTGGFRWTSRDNWLSDDICTYEGITCYTEEEDWAGHVREVDLAANHLAGTMPSDIFALPYLETLILRDNSDLFVEFDNIGQAQHLKTLVVSGTHTDSLKGIEGAASSLETLHITELGLTGTIPSEIFQLTNLRGLFANFNSFEGPLSPQIGNFYYMTDLYLYDNNLDGSIPTEVGQLVNLQTLSIGDNAWAGQLPTELNKCTELRTLSIQRSLDNMKGDGIKGDLLDLSTMPYINNVDLSHQQLSGNIPENFISLAPTDKPVTVDLRGNNIGGGIPSALAQKTRLTLLLADNQITTLSTSFCAQVNQWMGGDVEAVGSCDAILCPPGTFNDEGRKKSNEDICDTCATATYYGSTSCGAAPTTSKFDRDVLVALFNQMGGPYWKISTNWLNPAADVCSWFGVSCTNGRVSSINLRNNDLTKTPPADVFRLPELKVLNLAENNLAFSFYGIENAQNLEILDLTQTDLQSLEGIEGLTQTKITRLALGSNFIDQALPEDIFALPNLEELDLSHNFFTGAISPSIGNLSQLKRLFLFGNSFSGAIPTQLGQLVQLVELRAGENNFSGNLPTELNNLSKLEILSLHQTTSASAIQGTLPAFENLRQLTSLQLAGNALSGTLSPAFLQNTLRGSNRIEVLLSDNSLSGEIPSAWANRFDQLLLDLTGNQISSFGAGICSQTGWMDGAVQLFGCDAILCPTGTYNEFGRQSTAEGICRGCGQVSALGSKVCGNTPITAEGQEISVLQELFDTTHGNAWTNVEGWRTTSQYCSWYGISCDTSGKVVKINLSNNGLTGTPPPSIFNLASLRELDLSMNQITFVFDGIEKAAALSKLVLTSTNLNSVEGLENGQSLLELEIDDNDIGGSLPTELLALSSLKRLSANSNNIEGRIPANIASLKSLNELSLYHNRLTGPLPASIGGMTSLKILALSENNFEGTIPVDYNDLTSLEVLAIQREGGTSESDVGFNQGYSEDEGVGLSGPLPAFDQLKNLRRVFLGMNSLSGEIPDNFLGAIDDNNADIVVDLTSNRLNGGIPGALARFEKMSLYIAGNRLTEDIPEGICRQSGWMNGQVGAEGCDAIACPKNTASELGRKTQSSPCSTCLTGESTPYLGSFDCKTSTEHSASSEQGLLEELYRQTDGDGWRRNDYWLDPDVSVCQWFGVTCDGAGSVQSLDLMHNGLMGKVPSSIFQLKNMKELNVAGNDADMSFVGIANAQNLQYLNIDAMALSSLEGLGQATNLLQLHASQNGLGPDFPTELFSLSNIEVLYLSHNKFESQFPSGGSQWANLKSFSCENCGFVGFVPSLIGGWKQLQRLNLADNTFNGVFPIEIERLPELEYIDISKQRTSSSQGLSGFVPAFANLTKISQIFLQENSFFGTIPTNFLSATSSNEITVDLRRNEINGTIPVGLSRFQNAEFLFADNMLGAVPNSLCSLGWNDAPQGSTICDFVLCPIGTYNALGRATGTLRCDSCDSGTEPALYTGATGCRRTEREILKELFYNLEGSQWLHNEGWGTHVSVCEWYGVTCSSGFVRKLDLRGNNLVGTMPSTIWLLTEIEELDLSDNNIIVPSFEMITSATKLRTLKLSNNVVSSLDGIGGATSLQNFHCTSCEIHGPIPNEFYDQKVLETLYLNYNHLTGNITKMSSMTFLREIYLFSNELTGEIPLFNFRFAEVVSLGHNRFSGTIPSGYSRMLNLRVFSAEYEGAYDIPTDDEDNESRDFGLRGELPAFDNAPALRELYLAGNSLGRTIPSNFLANVDSSAAMHVDISSNNFWGTVPSELARFDDMHLLLANNYIDELPEAFCSKVSWMDGLVASYECDALLCPKGTYSEIGRRTPQSTCEPCDHRGMAQWYGSVSCGNGLIDVTNEREVLIEFYNTAGGDVWKDNTGWNSNAPFCQWYGISCTKNSEGEDSVSEVSLPSNNLVNRVASILFHLSNLRVLDVSGNAVGMTLRDINKAKRLEELNISNTNVMSLEGIGRATALRSLIASNNAFFQQEIPDELFSLERLTHLDISRNDFAGTLSPDFSSLKSLIIFDAAYNDLAGTIPDFWRNLSNLKKLDLSENLLYGEIPASVNALANLETLKISTRTRPGVGLGESLPAFSGMKKLRYLDLGANSLTGTVPGNLLAGIDSLNDQITVLLDSNMLHGTLPLSLNRFSRLNIDVTDNEIESISQGLCAMNQWWGGAVAQHQCDAILCPAGTFNDKGRQDSEDNRCEDCPGENSKFLGRTKCPSLQKAKAKKILEDFYEVTGGPNWKRHENWLTHPDICVWHGITCKDGLEIETVNLGSNNLSGEIPKEIFELYGLKNLWLFSNPIEFSFEGIEKAESLINLQLDSIGLESLSGIGKARSLSYLDVRFNSLDGPLSAEIEELTNLETLLISDNNLFGPLPSFDNNRKLSTVKAGGNGFTGPLPSFSFHPNLRRIDVTGNALNGEIPDNLLEAVDSSKPVLLYLANNKFSGILPSSLARFDDLTIFVNDNEITGIAEELCEQEKWNGGDVERFGCDGILCPPNTYSPATGRASSESGNCEPCGFADFFGHSVCLASDAGRLRFYLSFGVTLVCALLQFN